MTGVAVVGACIGRRALYRDHTAVGNLDPKIKIGSDYRAGPRARSLFTESRTRSIFFYFEHVLHAEPRTLRLNMLQSAFRSDGIGSAF